MEALIEVEQDDIDHGESKDCDKCPIARAGMRVVKDDLYIAVDGDLHVNSFGNRKGRKFLHSTPLPVVANQFMRDFDDGHEVKPFSFTVDIPRKYLKQERRHAT